METQILKQILQQKAETLGYSNPDDCIRDNWDSLPENIQRELIELGFKRGSE